MTESAWSQATLPVSSGGLGVRIASELALPAFFVVSCRVKQPDAIYDNTTAAEPFTRRVWLKPNTCRSTDTIQLNSINSTDLRAPSPVLDSRNPVDSKMQMPDRAYLRSIITLRNYVTHVVRYEHTFILRNQQMEDDTCKL
jgi:hypothetical protein